MSKKNQEPNYSWNKSIEKLAEMRKPKTAMSKDALQELWYKYRKMNWEFEYCENGCINLSDLTALISEGYVEREKYDNAIEAIKILNETIKQFTKENEQ